jgi:hypothetical protein
LDEVDESATDSLNLFIGPGNGADSCCEASNSGDNGAGKA